LLGVQVRVPLLLLLCVFPKWRHRQLRRVDWQALIDKIASRLATWKGKMMSTAGRLALLNAVLSSIPVYWLSVHKLPVWVRKKIDSIRRAWLWHGEVTCNGGHCKVAWGRICRPLDLGGLGILDLDRFSTALRLRWLWHERCSRDKPWVGMPVPCSLADQELFAVATRATIGDGKIASFWKDSWVDGGAPFLIAPTLFKASRRKCRSVAEALNDGKWILDLRGRVTADSLSEFVDLWDRVRRVTLVNGVADAFVWRFSADGTYSSKSAYRLQFLGATSSPFVKLIWSATAVPKCRFFGWLFALNRLLTADRLLARRWPNSYFCPLCRRNLETALHLLVECPWARRVWTAVAAAHHLPVLSPLTWGTPSSPLEWLASTIAAATVRDRKRTASTIFLVLWVLWKERNRRIFDNKDRPVAVVAAEVDDGLAVWALARGRQLVPRE
jgi:hypothetical protein